MSLIYAKESLEKYLNDLAAKLPAPGGGSAAALNAAMGAALLSMVLNFTTGKPKYAAHEGALRLLLEKTESLRGEFMRLVDLDVEAYQSKDMRRAMDVPFSLCRLSFEAIKLCPELIKKGNVNLASDVAVGAIFLEAAFTSAYFNVLINLKMLQDKSLSKKVLKELGQKMKTLKKIRQDTEVRVGEIIRG
jgi:formiminotetrahydrofolate cyclodeaminase